MKLQIQIERENTVNALKWKFSIKVSLSQNRDTEAIRLNFILLKIKFGYQLDKKIAVLIKS